MAINYVQQIVDAMNTEIAGVLGSSYKPLQYVFNVERNNFRQSNNRYGVLHRATSQLLEEVTRRPTYTQVFTVVLTKGYRDSAISDQVARDASIELHSQMLEIHKQLQLTKCGVPSVVVQVMNTLFIEDPEYIEEEKVTVLRADIEVMYRYDLI